MRPKQGMAVPQDGRFRARLENMVDPRRHPPLLQHAAVLIERRRHRYKIGRLHSVLRYRPPTRAGSGLVAPTGPAYVARRATGRARRNMGQLSEDPGIPLRG
jgi:hypothetical protein